MDRPNPWANENNAIKLGAGVKKRPCGCEYNAGFSWVLTSGGNFLVLFPTTGKDNADYFKWVIQGANGKETFAAVDVAKPEDVVFIDLLNTVGTNQDICIIFSAAEKKANPSNDCTCAVDFETKICCGATSAGGQAQYLPEGCTVSYSYKPETVNQATVTTPDPHIEVGETVNFHAAAGGGGAIIFSYVATVVGDAGVIDPALLIAAQNAGFDATGSFVSTANQIELRAPTGGPALPLSIALVTAGINVDFAASSQVDKFAVTITIPDAAGCTADLYLLERS